MTIERERYKLERVRRLVRAFREEEQELEGMPSTAFLIMRKLVASIEEALEETPTAPLPTLPYLRGEDDKPESEP